MEAVEEPRWLTAEEQQTWLELIGVLTWLPDAIDAQLQRAPLRNRPAGGSTGRTTHRTRRDLDRTREPGERPVPTGRPWTGVHVEPRVAILAGVGEWLPRPGKGSDVWGRRSVTGPAR